MNEGQDAKHRCYICGVVWMCHGCLAPDDLTRGHSGRCRGFGRYVLVRAIRHPRAVYRMAAAEAIDRWAPSIKSYQGGQSWLARKGKP